MTPAELPSYRRLRLYLGIARKLRPLGREARGVRRAAIQQAWDARREWDAEVLAEARRLVDELRGEVTT